MKKLSLKNLKLEANDMLQRNQLKSVFGGYGGYNTGTCAYQNVHGWVVIDASKSTAQAGAAESGGHWCCDSCCTASWTQGYGC